MGYIGTNEIIKQLGITREDLYALIYKGLVNVPIKQNGRYLWADEDVNSVARVLIELRSDKQKYFRIDEKHYLGNKAKYAMFLRQIADEYCPDFTSFADYFAGVGGSASVFADKELILNDIMYSSYSSLYAFYGVEEVDEAKLLDMIKKYNAHYPMGAGYITENFSGKYFGNSTAKKIDFIRDDIDKKFESGEINEREKHVLLTALLYAVDNAANIYAHYDTFKSAPVVWNTLELKLPKICRETVKENRIFNTDANILVSYTYGDVAYIDPPADSRQYSDIYHLPENIAKWNKPALSGKSLKPAVNTAKSLYCKKNADKVFEELIAKCNSRLILTALPKQPLKRNDRSASKLSLYNTYQVLKKKGVIHVEFPEFEQKEEEQLVLSYMFKDDSKKSADAQIKGGVIVCECDKKSKDTVDYPVNISNLSHTDLEMILPYLPSRINTCYSLFGNTWPVGFNSYAKKNVYIEREDNSLALFRYLNEHSFTEIEKSMEELISFYGLSDSYKNGYDIYGVTAEEGLGNVNREAFLRLRDDFNNGDNNGFDREIMLYTLLVYGYYASLRFNRKGTFNLNVGKRDWNRNVREKLKSFLEVYKDSKASFEEYSIEKLMQADYRSNDYCLVDMTAVENEDFEKLNLFLSKLTAHKIKYGLLVDRESYDSVKFDAWLEKEMDYLRIVYFDEDNQNKTLIINY